MMIRWCVKDVNLRCTVDGERAEGTCEGELAAKITLGSVHQPESRDHMMVLVRRPVVVRQRTWVGGLRGKIEVCQLHVRYMMVLVGSLGGRN